MPQSSGPEAQENYHHQESDLGTRCQIPGLLTGFFPRTLSKTDGQILQLLNGGQSGHGVAGDSAYFKLRPANQATPCSSHTITAPPLLHPHHGVS